MFTVDEATAASIRRAFDDGGELAGVVELCRHFPLINDNANARRCVRVSKNGAVTSLPSAGERLDLADKAKVEPVMAELHRILKGKTDAPLRPARSGFGSRAGDRPRAAGPAPRLRPAFLPDEKREALSLWEARVFGIVG